MPDSVARYSEGPRCPLHRVALDYDDSQSPEWFCPVDGCEHTAYDSGDHPSADAGVPVEEH